MPEKLVYLTTYLIKLKTKFQEERSCDEQANANWRCQPKRVTIGQRALCEFGLRLTHSGSIVSVGASIRQSCRVWHWRDIFAKVGSKLLAGYSNSLWTGNLKTKIWGPHYSKCTLIGKKPGRKVRIWVQQKSSKRRICKGGSMIVRCEISMASAKSWRSTFPIRYVADWGRAV